MEMALAYIIGLILINHCLAVPPCTPKELTASRVVRAECGSQITKVNCEKILDHESQVCRSHPASSTCIPYNHNPDECAAKTGCYWDCDGDLVNNLGSNGLYLSVKYIGRDSRFDQISKTKPNVRPKKSSKSKQGPTIPMKNGNDFEYVQNLYNERTDEIGVSYRAQVNPSAFFSKKEIKNKGYLLNGKSLIAKKHIIERIDRRRLADYNAADWEDLESNSYGILAYNARDMGVIFSKCVGSVIWHSHQNNQHYDHILTAGHCCKPDGQRLVRMLAAIGYNDMFPYASRGDDDPFVTDNVNYHIRPGGQYITHGFVADGNENNGKLFQTNIGVERYGNFHSWDYCVVRFEVDQDNSATYPIMKFQFNQKFEKNPIQRDINLKMKSYRIQDEGKHDYIQATAKGNKINYKIEEEKFCSVQRTYTEEGMSGSGLIDTGALGAIFGIHYGKDYYIQPNGQRGANVRSCAVRITRAIFINIFRWIGQDENANCITLKNPLDGWSTINFVASYCEESDDEEQAENVDYDDEYDEYDEYKEYSMIFNHSDAYQSNILLICCLTFVILCIGFIGFILSFVFGLTVGHFAFK